MLLLTMKAETEPAEAARGEMIEIVKAWKRGRLLPKPEAPTLQGFTAPSILRRCAS